MQFLFSQAQHQGKRQEQQDFLASSDQLDPPWPTPEGLLLALADGMGGYALGRQAAETAVQVAMQCLVDHGPSPAQLKLAAQAADQAVAGLNPGQVGPGTTLLLGWLHGEDFHWLSVGDSRIYLLRREEGNFAHLVCLTQDQTLGQDFLRRHLQGAMSLEEARQHPQRGNLLCYVGQAGLQDFDQSLTPLRLKAGDRLLLCSDGLFNSLTHRQILTCLKAPNCQAQDLVQAVLKTKNPRQDNLSVQLLDCQAGPFAVLEPPPRAVKSASWLSWLGWGAKS